MRRPIAALLALLALPAWADVTLSGSQHIGDAENSSFDPRDPVRRTQMQARPSHFHLSQDVVITAVRLDNPDDLDGRLQVFIDDMSTPLAGTLSGGTYTLATPRTLAAGTHTIWPDGGCSGGGFAMPCFSGDNDFGFSGITLLSSQITFSRALNRRTHLGDSTDGNDDYDGRWYPDAFDASTVSYGFTLEASRVLSEIRFYNLRNVETSPSSFASVRIDGVAVGTLTANADPFTLAPGTTLAAGAHTVSVVSGLVSGSERDDISWDDIVLVMINNPSTTPGQFNAVDEGADAATGPITTKEAGTAFNLDVVAVSGGAQFTAYSGTFSVQLVDASDVAGSCATWATLANLGNVTLAGTDNGRKTVTINYAEAARDVRVRMTDAALALSSCSTDNFAIRPRTLGNFSVSHDDARTPGTATPLATSGFSGTTQPVHRAGKAFTLQATAYNSVGAITTAYAGEPTVTATASVLGTYTGSATSSAWAVTSPGSGRVRSDAVKYDEAGAVTLEVIDKSFAAVDADDTADAVRWTVAATLDVGRFIPDHFTFAEDVAAEFTPGCPAGGFTYIGQDFRFTTPPQALVKAVAAGGTVTRNYSDAALTKIAFAAADTLPQSSYAVLNGTFDTTVVPNPDNTFVDEGNGVFRFTLIEPTAPVGYRFSRGAPAVPFDAEIGITLSLTDTDGVTFETTNLGRFGNAAAGEGIPFIGGNELRFGRLAIDNAYGSERLPLPVPLRAEYWNNGFQTNAQDSCTTLALTDLTVATGLTLTKALSAPAGGTWTLTLTQSPPQVPGTASITGVLGAAFPWLQTDDSDADLLYNNDPVGLATFGVASDRQRRIFQREVIGN